MPRKPKDDTPPGGWLAPGMADEYGNRAIATDQPRYAAGVKTVHGKKVWICKPTTPAVRAKWEREWKKLRAQAEKR
jgi:hypothetical protein